MCVQGSGLDIILSKYITNINTYFDIEILIWKIAFWNFFPKNWHRPMYLFPTCTHFKFEFFDRSKPFSYPVAIEVGNWQPTIFEKYEFQPVFLIFSIYKLKDHIIWSFWSFKIINTENQKKLVETLIYIYIG